MSVTASATLSDTALFQCPGDVYNEVLAADGTVRSHWSQLIDCLQHVPPPQFARRMQQAERMLRENGVTYQPVSDGSHQARPWQLDLLPLLIAAGEWSAMEKGLSQRARLINLVINNIYGSQTLIRDGLLPPEVLFANPEYQRPFVQLCPAETHPLFLYAAEMARSPTGQWFVMADRSEAPAGAGFALENRVVVSRTVPAALRRIQFQRLPSFFHRLKKSLARRCRREREDPRVVLLTHGPAHQYYFEDVYLARYLGYTLVEAGDLAVRNDTVFLKTLSGLILVDVVLTRSAELEIDPLEISNPRNAGVPGLLHAARCGNVTISNVPGCGILGAPVFMAFLPELCRQLLGEPLHIPSIATWWCGNPDSLKFILDRFTDLVVKPAFQKSGGEEFVVSDMSDQAVTAFVKRINGRPWEWVAQEKIKRSGVPVWNESGLRCGHVAMRTFLVEDEGDYHLMPGGLVRVAPDTGPLQLSASAGDGSKDLWIMTDGESPPVTLLAPLNQPVTLQRTTALFPSRVADNLFWLGRNLDRVDVLARVLRSLIERTSGERDSEAADVAFLQSALVELGHLAHDHESPTASNDDLRSPEAKALAVFSFARSTALAHAVAELDRLASLLQDWLSQDTWTAIATLAESFENAPLYPENDLSDIAVVLHRLIQDTAAVSGMVNDGMNRGPSWRFLELGRCIDRTVSTAQLLLCADLRRAPTPAAVLKAVIELLDVQMTYRGRYREQLQRNAVLDLGITDETNPRSLAFQIQRLTAQIDRLPTTDNRPLPGDEDRLVMKCAHAVRMLNNEDLAAASATSVVRALEEVCASADALSAVLTRNYLVHSGIPRRIGTMHGERQ
jgi:uncharacterized circularly permuted ATP-grasp superfamily protein/uncharacterized alpha-E superfamily protein